MPVREAFGDAEYAALIEAAQFYRQTCTDPGYGGPFEQRFCDAFSAYMGGGFSDAVATGTASVYIALAALQLRPGDEVLMSPVTDSGPLNCIILQNLKPVLVDSRPHSYNVGPAQFEAAITPRTKAFLAVHSAGEPLDMPAIMEIARKHGIAVIEDCSQAPGATVAGHKVGGFGDIAAFSTMYRKSLMSGSSGGVVFTRDSELFKRAQAHADRGKQVWRKDLNQNDPGNALFPALNFNTDEFSCAIASASLARLDTTVKARADFCTALARGITANCKAILPPEIPDGISPFYVPIRVDTSRLDCSKNQLAEEILSEGIALLPQYGCIVSDWPWARKHLPSDNFTPNATAMKLESFNLFVNERYTETELKDILAAFVKVERKHVRC